MIKWGNEPTILAISSVTQFQKFINRQDPGDCISTKTSEDKHHFFHRLSLNTESKLKDLDKIKTSTKKENQSNTRTDLVL